MGELSITVVGDDASDLETALAQLDAEVERFESRQLTGAESVILLVQAAAPVIAAVWAEVVSWLRSRKESGAPPRDLEVVLPNGVRFSVTNATDEEIARAEELVRDAIDDMQAPPDSSSE